MRRMPQICLGSRKLKYRVKAAYVIINFVMNSAGPPRTLDSIFALRCAVPHPLCTSTFKSLEWNEAKKTAVVEESCHPTGDS